MLSAWEFNQLSLKQRTELLWMEGIRLFEYISDRKYICVIYAVLNFFVHISYRPETYAMEEIRALITYQDWSGYLDELYRYK
jgi:hypothetical protein